MPVDPPRRRKPIPTTRSSRAYFKVYGQEAANCWAFSLRLKAMRHLLKGDPTSVSERVLRGICRHHDDMMVRLAMIPAVTPRELADKVKLLEGRAPAMPENSLLPHMISAALVENAVRLATPDESRRTRWGKK